MIRTVLFVCLLTPPLLATAGERLPVAVLWRGDPSPSSSPSAWKDAPGRPEQIVSALNTALAHGATARPIDSVEDQRLLVAGGPSTRLDLLVRRGEAAYGKL